MKTELREPKQKQKTEEKQGGKSGKEQYGNLTVLWSLYENCPIPELRNEWDRIKDRISSTVVVFMGIHGEKTGLLVCLSPDLRGKSSIHCGNLAKTGGKAMDAGGGGRPDMGQAGGKNPEKAEAALRAVLSEIEKTAEQHPES
jgi:alanyl-tRNA synthetase